MSPSTFGGQLKTVVGKGMWKVVAQTTDSHSPWRPPRNSSVAFIHRAVAPGGNQPHFKESTVAVQAIFLIQKQGLIKQGPLQNDGCITLKQQFARTA